MSIEIITLVTLGSIVLGLFTGIPVAFGLGGISLILTYFFWGPSHLDMVSFIAWGIGQDFLLLAAPLFILMGQTLQSSGIGENLYTMMHRWMGPVRGGLAVGTVLICTIFAAMSGVSAAATLTMGIVALPAMLNRGYHKTIAIGSILGGGALGILIPPSLVMIVYSSLTGVSLPKLFMAGILPGCMLSGFFCIYILIRCLLKPTEGPALPIEERAGFKAKLTSLTSVALPLGIVILVLGTMYTGAATPTEAAALGTIGCLIAAAIHRKLNKKVIKEIAWGSFQTTIMVFWILIGASCFRDFYSAVGGSEFVAHTMANLPVGRYVILAGIQCIIFILGMLMDPVGIVILGTPIFLPIIKSLGFDPLWFGILFTMNLETSYLTPPFGMNLFFIKGVAPKEVTMKDIYLSIIPFVALQILALSVVIMFPGIAMYIPSKM